MIYAGRPGSSSAFLRYLHTVYDPFHPNFPQDAEDAGDLKKMYIYLVSKIQRLASD